MVVLLFDGISGIVMVLYDGDMAQLPSVASVRKSLSAVHSGAYRGVFANGRDGYESERYYGILATVSMEGAWYYNLNLASEPWTGVDTNRPFMPVSPSTTCGTQCHPPPLAGTLWFWGLRHLFCAALFRALQLRSLKGCLQRRRP